MKARLLVLALAATQLTALPSSAQTIKPGWWKFNNKISTASAETDQAMSVILQQLANLEPAQRQMVQQIAASHGVSMPSIGPDGTVGMTACVTPAMAARRQLPTGQAGDCTSNNVAVSGGMKMAFTCANPPSSGHGRLSFNGDSGFTMTMNITTSARGQPEQVTVDTSAQWLTTVCPGAR